MAMNEEQAAEWLELAAARRKAAVARQVRAARKDIVQDLRAAELLRGQPDDLTPAAKARIRARAEAVENEWLDEKLEERRAMAARGEDIVVPDDREGLRAQLAKEQRERRRG